MASDYQSPYQDFWGKVGPGLLDLGLGLYSKRQGQNEAAGRLATAQGPVYNQAMSGASGMLTQAGNFNPQDFATQRFGQQQAILDPVYQKQTDDLMRSLYAKGMLGAATYNPGVPGITPNGTAMNPQMAALFAAQNAQRSKDAYNSMQYGQDYLNNLITQSGMLSKQAQQVQNTGITADNRIPSRSAGNTQLIRGGLDVLKQSGVLPGLIKSGAGMLGTGIDWVGRKLTDLFGGGGGGSGLGMTGDFSDSFNFT